MQEHTHADTHTYEDDKAGLRGYVQFNKTHKHGTYCFTYYGPT